MAKQKRNLTPPAAPWLVAGLVLAALALAGRSEGATTTVIDASAHFAFPSIEVGGDGLGLVAYYDQDYHDLKVAHCNDLACTSATLTVLDSYGDVGADAALAIGADGLGLIAYLSSTDSKLKTAHCSNAACTSATITTHVDAEGAISMVTGSDGRGLIAFRGSAFNGLRVAHCNDVSCTAITSAPLADRQMPYTSMVVGADGLALIGIIDSITDRLEVAHCGNVACTTATLTEVDVADCHTWPTRPLALGLGPDGLGLVAYTDGSQAVKVAHCGNAACTSATTTTVEVGVNGADVGFEVGACRLGLIAYTYQNGLLLAHCDNGTCSRATLLPLDAGFGALAQNRSVTTGSDGVPLIAYAMYEGSYGPRLKVTHLDPWPLPTKGDFDRDGQVDLVYRHATTDRSMVWLMNGASRKAASWVTPDPPSPAWRTVAVDDFDSAASPGSGPDGQSDLVLHNGSTGEVQFWLMNGAGRVGPAVALSGGPPLPAPWQLAASGDFDDDGRPDLLWRNGGTQKLAVWTMNGTARLGSLVPTPDQAVDANWVVTAALDLNGDLHRDLLWYNVTSGKIVHWWLNAGLVRIAGLFNDPASAGHANWSVQAGGDFGPGAGGARCSKDLVWRNATSGKNVVWWEDFAAHRTAGGFTVPDSALTDPDGNPTAATDWLLVGPK